MGAANDGATAVATHSTANAKPDGVSRSSEKADDENAVPIGHEPIYSGENIIGQTTSCAFGYRIGKPIALGFSDTPLKSGDRVKVDIARTLFDATVTIGTLYDPDGSRMKS